MGGRCECTAGACGANCSGAVLCHRWDEWRSEWSLEGMETVSAGQLAVGGTLECRADNVPATAFAGVCLLELPLPFEPPSVAALTLPDDSALSGTAASIVSIVLCALLNWITVRRARHARQSPLPPSERDPVWGVYLRAWWWSLVHVSKQLLTTALLALAAFCRWTYVTTKQLLTTAVLAVVALVLWCGRVTVEAVRCTRRSGITTTLALLWSGVWLRQLAIASAHVLRGAAISVVLGVVHTTMWLRRRGVELLLLFYCALVTARDAARAEMVRLVAILKVEFTRLVVMVKEHLERRREVRRRRAAERKAAAERRAAERKAVAEAKAAESRRQEEERRLEAQKRRAEANVVKTGRRRSHEAPSAAPDITTGKAPDDDERDAGPLSDSSSTAPIRAGDGGAPAEAASAKSLAPPAPLTREERDALIAAIIAEGRAEGRAMGAGDNRRGFAIPALSITRIEPSDARSLQPARLVPGEVSKGRMPILTLDLAEVRGGMLGRRDAAAAALPDRYEEAAALRATPGLRVSPDRSKLKSGRISMDVLLRNGPGRAEPPPPPPMTAPDTERASTSEGSNSTPTETPRTSAPTEHTEPAEPAGAADAGVPVASSLVPPPALSSVPSAQQTPQRQVRPQTASAALASSRAVTRPSVSPAVALYQSMHPSDLDAPASPNLIRRRLQMAPPRPPQSGSQGETNLIRGRMAMDEQLRGLDGQLRPTLPPNLASMTGAFVSAEAASTAAAALARPQSSPAIGPSAASLSSRPGSAFQRSHARQPAPDFGLLDVQLDASRGVLEQRAYSGYSYEPAQIAERLSSSGRLIRGRVGHADPGFLSRPASATVVAPRPGSAAAAATAAPPPPRPSAPWQTNRPQSAAPDVMASSRPPPPPLAAFPEAPSPPPSPPDTEVAAPPEAAAPPDAEDATAPAGAAPIAFETLVAPAELARRLRHPSRDAMPTGSRPGSAGVSRSLSIPVLAVYSPLADSGGTSPRALIASQHDGSVIRNLSRPSSASRLKPSLSRPSSASRQPPAAAAAALSRPSSAASSRAAALTQLDLDAQPPSPVSSSPSALGSARSHRTCSRPASAARRLQLGGAAGGGSPEASPRAPFESDVDEMRLDEAVEDRAADAEQPMPRGSTAWQESEAREGDGVGAEAPPPEAPLGGAVAEACEVEPNPREAECAAEGEDDEEEDDEEKESNAIGPQSEGDHMATDGNHDEDAEPPPEAHARADVSDGGEEREEDGDEEAEEEEGGEEEEEEEEEKEEAEEGEPPSSEDLVPSWDNEYDLPSGTALDLEEAGFTQEEVEAARQHLKQHLQQQSPKRQPPPPHDDEAERRAEHELVDRGALLQRLLQGSPVVWVPSWDDEYGGEPLEEPSALSMGGEGGASSLWGGALAQLAPAGPQKLEDSRWRAALAAARPGSRLGRCRVAASEAAASAAAAAEEARRQRRHASLGWQKASAELARKETEAAERRRELAAERAEAEALAAAQRSAEAAEFYRLRKQLEERRFFSLDVYSTRCSRAYLDALTRWHSILVLACQPHPPLGQPRHMIDLEMHVQCFWSALMLELGVLALLASSQAPTDEPLDDGWLVLDATVAAIAAGACGLAAGRAAFLVSGPAGRVLGTFGMREGPSHCTCSGVDGVWAPGKTQLARRVLRSSTGWLFSWSVFVGGAALAFAHMAGVSVRRASSLVHGWMLSQAISWLLVEPAGIALVLAAFYGPAWLRQRRQQRSSSTAKAGKPRFGAVKRALVASAPTDMLRRHVHRQSIAVRQRAGGRRTRAKIDPSAPPRDVTAHPGKASKADSDTTTTSWPLAERTMDVSSSLPDEQSRRRRAFMVGLPSLSANKYRVHPAP